MRIKESLISRRLSDNQPASSEICQMNRKSRKIRTQEEEANSWGKRNFRNRKRSSFMQNSWRTIKNWLKCPSENPRSLRNKKNLKGMGAQTQDRKEI